MDAELRIVESTLSLAHINHVNTGTYGMPCQRCHATTVTAAGAIADYSVHVNGARNYSGGGWVSPEGLTIDGSGMVLQANHTCTASYCHSNGQNRTAAPYTSTSNAWNAAAPACTNCHATTGLASAPARITR